MKSKVTINFQAIYKVTLEIFGYFMTQCWRSLFQKTLSKRCAVVVAKRKFQTLALVK